MPIDSPLSVRGGAVLLVEDDNEVSALTREMLGCLGFSVIHVMNPGGAFYVLAEARAVDVILSDIMMPGGMNGLEFAREVRRRYPHLPIVLTTGYAEAATSMKPSEFKLLLKPYSAAALAEALNVERRDPRALMWESSRTEISTDGGMTWMDELDRDRRSRCRRNDHSLIV